MLKIIPRSLCLILCFSALLFASPKDVQMLNSSQNSLVLEYAPPEWRMDTRTLDRTDYTLYSVPGCDLAGDAGSPALPVRILTIAVPQGAAVSAVVLAQDFVDEQNVNLLPMPQTQRVEEELVPVYLPNAEIYNQNNLLPQQLVQIDEPTVFRGYRTVKVYIYPLQYNPASKQVKKLTRLQVQLNYNGAQSARQNKLVQYDELAAQVLLNYEQAKNWQDLPRPSLSKPSAIMDGDNWYKVVIEGNGAGGKEGMYKITGKALKDAGISLSAIDATTLQLFNNGGMQIADDIRDVQSDSLTETPLWVSTGNDDNFGESDYVLFYGRSLEGIAFNAAAKEWRHYINVFGYENVYWLTFNQRPGKRMLTRNSEAVAGLQPAASFQDLVWLEDERYNLFNSGTIWLGYELSKNTGKSSFTTTFNLTNVMLGDAATFRFSLASASVGKHYFNFYANGNSLGSYSQDGGEKIYTLRQTTKEESGVLINGDNTISISFNASNESAFSYVDWIELQYAKQFIADDDIFYFSTPLADSLVRMQITGFSSNDVRVFDVSDVGNIYEIAPAQISNGTVDLALNCSAYYSHRLIALTNAKFKSITLPTDAKTTMNNLRVQKDVDYIIITNKRFYQQAQTLESLRENWSPKFRYETEIVDYQDVINQFGCGIPDPGAVRNFLAYAQRNWNNPGYVLLLGDGHYDYRDIQKFGSENFIVPYQTDDTNVDYTRTTDDWFVYTNGNNNEMQMAIGRLPVRTVQDAKSIVDKIVDYETEPEYGEWLKTITMVGDDDMIASGVSSDGARHTDEADDIAERALPNNFDISKIYLFEYPTISNPSWAGVEKPAATTALLQQINRGSLVINFLGHGNDELWTHERLLLRSRDSDLIQNGKKTALWIAATCEFAHWDQIGEQSFAEDILLMQDRGAVGMISSARLAFSPQNGVFNKLFYMHLFDDYENTGMTLTLGSAAINAKSDSYDKSNNEKYAIFGEPVMRLCAPFYKAVIDSISPDSIQALSKMTIIGHIVSADSQAIDYNGSLNIRLMDNRKYVKHVIPSSPNSTFTVDYKLPGNTLFHGVTKIENGKFKVELIVPKDVSYGGQEGSISIYFNNESSSGSGYKKNLAIGGTSVDLVDNDGPRMTLRLGDENYKDGDYVSTTPIVHLDIADSLSGVNTAGDVGHKIMLTIDEDFTNARDITEYFTYSEGSYTAGTLDYPIYDMALGEHNIEVKAWDNSNNSSIAETHFIVLDDSELKIRDLLNYPNPMADETSFRFELSQAATVSIKIYTVAGRMIKKFSDYQQSAGYNIFPEIWDGRDDEGDLVANGVYLYKVSAKTENDGKKLHDEKISKILVTK